MHSHLCPLGTACNVGVQVDGEVLPADAVVIALGPWTNTLASSLQLPHISGQLGHSIVLKPSASSSSNPIPADCLFLSWQSKSGDADTHTHIQLDLSTVAIFSWLSTMYYTWIHCSPVYLVLLSGPVNRHSVIPHSSRVLSNFAVIPCCYPTADIYYD